MYGKIMVCIDDSDARYRVLDEAICLAAADRAQLHIVHVIDLPYLLVTVSFYDPVTLTASLRAKGAKLLEEAQQRASSASMPCTTQLAETEQLTETIAARLQRCAEDCGAALVVLGAHGHRSLDAVLPGSVVNRLGRIATHPILLVPARTQRPSAGTLA
ncbi:universal stress protein [Paraburkholderia phenazinium]|uniref:Nucleotide-binding universal stress protein, UspA family n=1 Tax=Paraburkholderia phenazinium TaxID=60549 RepID=A0A1G8JS67_9BURK|nr:universal stress protein [Paraburkholderia phenazinium]SDI33390.1 Nucleotide-binding universal stress protein, UspA family [Paraburkholderia phenazinium]